MLRVGRASAVLPRAGALLRTCQRFMSASPPKKDTLRALTARQSLKGEVVLVRADLNLPLTKGDGPVEITDATRLIEALPSIRMLIDAGAKVVCCSHLGRPKKAKSDAEKARYVSYEACAPSNKEFRRKRGADLECNARPSLLVL